MIATALDHVGVAVHDLDAAAAEWEAIGFQVTPRASHGPGATTANRCIMLQSGYIELIAGPSATLARFLAAYEGIHVLSLTTQDAEQAAARLGRELISSERETEHGTARFARVALTELAPRLQLIEHKTPELVWRPELCIHQNGATALRAILITTSTPAERAAALSRAAGRPVVPDPDGGYALRLDHGEIRIRPGPFAIGLSLTAPTRQTTRASGVNLSLAP